MVNTKTAVPTGTNNSPSIEGRGLNSRFSRFNFTKSILFILIAFSTLLILSGSAMALDVNTIDDLKAIGSGSDGNSTNAAWTMTATYDLKTDLIITGDWPSIANVSNRPFNGTFNGNGYNITFDKSGSEIETQGLFRYVQDPTFNRVNVTVNNTTLNITSNGGGVIAGYSRANSQITFTNCHVEFVDSAKIKSNGIYVGGLIGISYNSTPTKLVITDCSVNGGTIEGVGLFGSFAGFTNAVNVTNSNASVNLSTVSGSVTNGGGVGGLIGSVDGTANLSGSNYTGKISSINNNNAIGGLVGHLRGVTNTVELTNCRVTSATITSSGSYVGGLIGRSNGTVDIDSCSVSDLSLTGLSVVGGLVGGSVSDYVSPVVVSPIDISNSNVTSSVITSTSVTTTPDTVSTVGGLVGTSLGKATLTNSYFKGNVTGSGLDAGGLIGRAATSTLNSYSNCYATGNITGYGRVGGLIGFAGGSNSDQTGTSAMNKCYFEGNVFGSGSNTYYVTDSGGLIGRAAYASGLSISECYSTGSVESNLRNAGGLIGALFIGTTSIDDCYSASSIYVRNGVPALNVPGVNDHSGYGAGGLVGAVGSSFPDPAVTLNINNSYSAGIIVSAASGRAGGLIGYAVDSTSFADPTSLTPSVHAIVKIKDSYSLVSNVSAPLYAGPVIGDYDPTQAGASTFTNVRAWDGMGGSNNSKFTSFTSVARNAVYDTYGNSTTQWTTFSSNIWKPSTPAYGLPTFKASGMDNQPDFTPINDINKGGSSSGGGGSGGATVSGNNNTNNNTTQDPPVYTPPNGTDSNPNDPDTGSDNSSDTDSDNSFDNGSDTDSNIGSDTESLDSDSDSKTGIWWCIIAFVALIAAVVVYFVKFRGKDY